VVPGSAPFNSTPCNCIIDSCRINIEFLSNTRLTKNLWPVPVFTLLRWIHYISIAALGPATPPRVNSTADEMLPPPTPHPQAASQGCRRLHKTRPESGTRPNEKQITQTVRASHFIPASRLFRDGQTGYAATSRNAEKIKKHAGPQRRARGERGQSGWQSLTGNSRRSLTTSALPSLAALCKGVSPSLSHRVGDALLPRSRSATFACPAVHARIRGVAAPSDVRASTLLPWSRRILQTVVRVKILRANGQLCAFPLDNRCVLARKTAGCSGLGTDFQASERAIARRLGCAHQPRF
jgi:hypothetical protein